MPPELCNAPMDIWIDRAGFMLHFTVHCNYTVDMCRGEHCYTDQRSGNWIVQGIDSRPTVDQRGCVIA